MCACGAAATQPAQPAQDAPPGATPSAAGNIRLSRRAPLLALIAVLLAAAGCAAPGGLPGQRTGARGASRGAEIHGSADFARLRTFDWLRPAATSQADRVYRGSLTEKRAMNAVERELAARGRERVAGSPDFLVAYHAGDASGTPAEHLEHDALVIDFVDAATGALLWRAWEHDAVRSPEEERGRIDDAVARMIGRAPFR